MIRFYGFGWREALNLPIALFWALNRQISRLRAEEALALLPATAAAGMGANINNLVQQLRAEIGVTVATTVLKRDEREFSRLKNLLSKGVGEAL